MSWMNEYDVKDAVRKHGYGQNPNLSAAVLTLEKLMEWTNSHSDGWPYWRKPSQAAAKLQSLIQGVDRWDPEDVSDAALKAAITPIKAFCTRQGIAHSEIVVSP